MTRVAVVGAGVIGLVCADELVHRGHDVTVHDATPGGGATRAAAGMLSPLGEAWFGESALFALGLASARMWPELARRWGTAADIDLRQRGTVLVGLDRDDLGQVRRTAGAAAEFGAEVEELSRHRLRTLEPGLSTRVAGGVWLPEDHQVNPRRVVRRLLERLGARVVREHVEPSAVRAEIVVDARGAGAGLPGTRRVRGEILRLRGDLPIERVLRARVQGDPVYLVPRADGEVALGATERDLDGEPVPTVEGVARLLDSARRLFPGIDRAEVLEVLARDRPGTADNGPLIGWWQDRIVAAGHHRGGVLLAPVTAHAVAELIAGHPVPETLRAFAPDRFTTRDIDGRDPRWRSP